MKTETKNTKIVCTLGPACDDAKTIEKMVKAGMNVARLNFSHGTYDHFKKIISNIRKVSKKLDQPIAIIQDLQGPKIRIGTMPDEGIRVKDKQKIVLTTEKINGQIKNGTPFIPVQYKNLPKDVKKGDTILIEDGLLNVKVEKTTKDKIFCVVCAGGIVKSNKGINVPTCSVSANPLTAKDKKDLEFGLRHNVEYVALSFVRNGNDIKTLKKLIKAKRKNAKIIAKVERHEAVKHLKEIVKEADGLMVARGDLGTEVDAARVPIIQKRMIIMAKRYGKPIIVATQMLQSMIEHPIATRAEVSDAANAVFDETDALMLSNETAVGQYPIRAVETLSHVAHLTEKTVKSHEEFEESKIRKADIPISNATCLNGAKLALDIKAKYIVAITMSGFTAQNIAKHRLYIPIIAITEDEKVKDQLSLVWGLNNVYVHDTKAGKEAGEVKRFLKKRKLVKKGDEIVVVSNASKKEKLISTIVI